MTITVAMHLSFLWSWILSCRASSFEHHTQTAMDLANGCSCRNPDRRGWWHTSTTCYPNEERV